MAFVDGIWQFRGSVGNLSFYQLNGRTVVRQKGGPSREMVLKDKRFAASRQHMREFGGASRIGKWLRTCLHPEFKLFGGAYVSGRLGAALLKGLKNGPGEAGQRSFVALLNGAVLNGFELAGKKPVAAEWLKLQAYSLLPNRNGIVLHVLVSHSGRKVPNGATHMRVHTVLGCLPDFHWDAMRQTYVPVSPELAKLRVTDTTVRIGLNEQDKVLHYQLEFNGIGRLPVTTGLVLGLGVCFEQEVNGEWHGLTSGRGMVLRCY